jgi:hypothetical protein
MFGNFSMEDLAVIAIALDELNGDIKWKTKTETDRSASDE